MIEVRCTYDNGETIETRFNGTFDDAKDYFLGKYVNVGILLDDVQECISVELL